MGEHGPELTLPVLFLAAISRTRERIPKMTGYEATERTSGKSHESNRVIWGAPFPLRDLLKVPVPSRRFSELLVLSQKVVKILLLRLFIN